MKKKTNAMETPDWTISELYEKAWKILKDNKVLWIFGMAVAGFAANSLNFNNTSSFKNLPNLFNPSPKPETPQQLTQVLGATTSQPFTDKFHQILATIPTELIVILIIEVFLLALFLLILFLIQNTWAQTSLLQAIQSAINNQKPTIQNSSEKSFPLIKPFIWLAIVPTLVLFLLVVFIFVIPTILVFIPGLKIAAILLYILATLLALYAAFYLTLSQILAPRILVTENTTAKAALFKAYRVCRRKKWSMLLLGIVNLILSGLVIGLPLALLIGLLVGGFASLYFLPNLGITLLIFGGLLFFTLIIGYLFLSGLLAAFKATIWSLAYHKIKRKYG